MRIIQLVMKKATNNPIIISKDQRTFRLPRSGVAESANTNKNIKINPTIVLYPLNSLNFIIPTEIRGQVIGIFTRMVGDIHPTARLTH
jgi:hypothetical protein